MLEAEIDRPLADYDSLIIALRRLRIPAKPTTDELDGLYTVCYRILGVAQAGAPPRLPGGTSDAAQRHLQASAADKIHTTFYDTNVRRAARQRAERSKPAPTFQCPFTREEAERRIAPYLKILEDALEETPFAHVSLAWAVERAGYAPFHEIITEWVALCDARGLGVPGTGRAVTLAASLCGEAEALEARVHTGAPLPGWTVMRRRIAPLIEDPHPLVAAHAARVLGAWYSGATDRQRPAIQNILARFSVLNGANAAVAGGFIKGFDTDGTGLAALADELPDAFDLDSWSIELLSKDAEPLLPGVEAFWYYVKEYYDHSPAFVHRLIDQGLTVVALRCATEWREPVAGMDRALQRLAVQPDPAIAARAFDHLAEIYSGHTTQH